MEYKLVPVDVTEEMVEAVKNANIDLVRDAFAVAVGKLHSALLAAAPSPEWVKVSERLPTREDADESGMCWMLSADEGVCTMLAEFAFEFEDQFGVTHWMPKPRQQPPAPPTEAEGTD